MLSNNSLKSELLSLMRQQFFSPKHTLGQNFLIDSVVFQRILSQLSLSKNDVLIEIGMGPGLLSRELAQNAGLYIGYEVDRRFAPIHDVVFSGLDLNTQFIYEDALKTDYSSYYDEISAYERIVIFSNLPYYITTDLILKMILSFPQAASMLFMLEEAVLERLLAKPATKAYGPLSIITSLWGNWKKLMTVSGQSFIPSPRTTSVLYELKASDNKNVKKIAADQKFQNFTTQILQNRRKTLSNALMYTDIADDLKKHQLLRDYLEAEALPDNVRAEVLNALQFVKLYLYLSDETDQAGLWL